MYDFIYPQIEEECLIPHVAPKVRLEKIHELTGIKLAYK